MTKSEEIRDLKLRLREEQKRTKDLRYDLDKIKKILRKPIQKLIDDFGVEVKPTFGITVRGCNNTAEIAPGEYHGQVTLAGKGVTLATKPGGFGTTISEINPLMDKTFNSKSHDS